MSRHSSQPTRWAWFSPWLIIGSVCILAAILVVLAVKNVHREREFMLKTLITEANVLIDSLEASSRTGMRGMRWGKRQVQLLMEETAQQPNIVYITLLTSSGQVVAASEADLVGKLVPFTAPQPGQIVQRFVSEGRKSFEVTRAYRPWTRHRRRAAPWSKSCVFPQETSRNGESCGLDLGASGDGNLFIIVGLDPAPFEGALRQDLQQTGLLFGIMFLVGGGGIVSLVWAQHYRSARTSLQEIRAFTSTIMGQMPVGLLTLDRSGQIQKTNEAGRRILRVSGLSGSIEDFPCFLPIAARLEREQAVVEEEVRHRIEQGEEVPLLVNASAIREGDDIAGYVLLFTDISHIKRLEDQLRRSERLAALGMLAAGVAHEIRNPLSSIKGFAKILAGRFRDGDSGRKIAAVMEHEVERLNRVVTELLDFARPTELKKHTCSVEKLIDDTRRLVESDAIHQGVRVETFVEPESLEAEVDPDRFVQVLLNLSLNGLQAMEGGGVLRIEAVQEGQDVVFRVIDSGAGIAPEHLSHIFDPYFTTKPRGVGLGLANVHKLLESHGADIQVLSSVGQGTTFTIRIRIGQTGEEHAMVPTRQTLGDKPLL